MSMRLNPFQKIGLVGLGCIVVGALFGIIVPQLFLGGANNTILFAWLFLALGGPLLMAGIIGNFLFVIYRAGAEGERRRLGLPPTNR